MAKPLNPARTPTIADVARTAAVGKTSVSRYLNGETAVLSEPLRTRIERAIEALGYRPSQMARALRQGRTRMVGMLVADLSNPYTVEIMRGVERACGQYGYMPLLCHAANQLELEKRYLDLLQTYRVEGMIINPVGMPRNSLAGLIASGTPTVLVDRRDTTLDCDVVGLDNSDAARRLAEHLLASGFQHVFYVTAPFDEVSSRRERKMALERHLHAGGARCQVLVVQDDGPAAFDRLLAPVFACCARARSAVVAGNGQTMLHIALAVARQRERERGAAAPALGMATFDEPDWIPLDASGITTLRQPTLDIGCSAVECLHARIEGSRAEAIDKRFRAELTVRASTHAPRALEATRRTQPVSHV